MLLAWVWIIHFGTAGALYVPASGVWQNKVRDNVHFQRKSTRLHNSMDELLLYADLTQKLYQKYNEQFRNEQRVQSSISERGTANAVSIQVQPLSDSPADRQQLTIDVDVLQLGSAFLSSFIIIKLSSWFKNLFKGEQPPAPATPTPTPTTNAPPPPSQQQQPRQARQQNQYAEVIYTPPPANKRYESSGGAWQSLSQEDSTQQKPFNTYHNVIDTTVDPPNSSIRSEEEEVEENGRSVRELLEDSPLGFLCKIRKRLMEINE